MVEEGSLNGNCVRAQHLKKALSEASKSGLTHYTTRSGVIELRKAVSAALKGRRACQ